MKSCKVALLPEHLLPFPYKVPLGTHIASHSQDAFPLTVLSPILPPRWGGKEKIPVMREMATVSISQQSLLGHLMQWENGLPEISVWCRRTGHAGTNMHEPSGMVLNKDTGAVK